MIEAIVACLSTQIQARKQRAAAIDLIGPEPNVLAFK